MAAVVYILCTLTSGLCAALLLREHARTSSRLLFWSGLSFAVLAVSNALVFVDFVVAPTVDFAVYRGVVFLGGVGLLLYGLVREGD